MYRYIYNDIYINIFVCVICQCDMRYFAGRHWAEAIGLAGQRQCISPVLQWLPLALDEPGAHGKAGILEALNKPINRYKQEYHVNPLFLGLHLKSCKFVPAHDALHRSSKIFAEDHNVKLRLPMTYAIYGDQGDYNAQTWPSQTRQWEVAWWFHFFINGGVHGKKIHWAMNGSLLYTDFWQRIPVSFFSSGSLPCSKPLHGANWTWSGPFLRCRWMNWMALLIHSIDWFKGEIRGNNIAWKIYGFL